MAECIARQPWAPSRLSMRRHFSPQSLFTEGMTRRGASHLTKEAISVKLECSEYGTCGII